MQIKSNPSQSILASFNTRYMLEIFRIYAKVDSSVYPNVKYEATLNITHMSILYLIPEIK